MENTTELHLNVTGMHCDACVRRLSTSLGKLPGVQVENVQVGEARLRYEAASITPAQIAQAVEKIGFTAIPQ